MVATVSHRRRHLDSQFCLAARPPAHSRLLKTSMRLWSWTIGRVANHGVAANPVRFFCASVCTPSFSALDWLIAVQASFGIALLDPAPETCERCFGQVNDVAGFGFRFAFQVSPRKGFSNLTCLPRPLALLMNVDLFTSPLRVSHLRCATQNGQPAENGRLPAL